MAERIVSHINQPPTFLVEQQDELYPINLRSIRNINFTSRELDIIAFILAGRTAKKTAAFFSISPRTVEIHIRNIMSKLGCNSRESIIDFVEKSDKFMLIKKHYSQLLIKAAYEFELKKLLPITKKLNINCLILHHKKHSNADYILAALERTLHMVGVTTHVKAWEQDKAKQFLTNKKTIHYAEQTSTTQQQIDYVIYLLSPELIEELKVKKYNLQDERAALIPMLTGKPNSIIYLCGNDKTCINFIENNNNFNVIPYTCINFDDYKNLYFFILAILQRLLTTLNIESIITQFKNHYETLMDFPALQKTEPDPNLILQDENPATDYRLLKDRIVRILLSGLLTVSIALIIFYLLKPKSLLESQISTISQALPQSTNLIQPTQTDAAAEINTLSVKSQNITTQNSRSLMLFNVPQHNCKFTGRKEILQQIMQHFNDHQMGIVTQVISGMGGVGKTQVATKFAYQAAEQKLYQNILWIHAASLDAINNSYREFASLLQIDIRGLRPNEIQTAVHSKLAENPKNSKILFVLDNVTNNDDAQTFISNLTTQLPMNFTLHVLITSRSQYWLETPIILEAFTPREALLFVKKHLPNEEKQSMYTLANTLYYFPLALGQAVAYIKAHTNIDDYLALYNDKEKNYHELFEGEENQYSKSLWKTWYIAFSTLSRDAQNILFMSAYLYPDNIPIALFDDLNIEDRVQAIKDLRKHSFIILTKNNKAFKIHPLLQEVIRTNKALIDKPKFYGLIKAMTLFRSKFTFDNATTKDDSWSIYGQYVMHAQALADHATKVNSELIPAGIQLYAKVAMYLTYRQQNNKVAFQIWKKIINLVEQNYSNDRSLMLVLANLNTHLGFVMRQIGNLQQAEKYLSKSMAIYSSQLPTISDNSEKLLSVLRWDKNLISNDGVKADHSLCLLNYGHVKKAMADFNDSKVAYEQALKILDSCKRNDFTRLYKVSILQSLGNLYRHMCNVTDAERTLHLAKQIVNSDFPDHVEQAYVYEGLANLLYYMGKYAEAKEEIEKSLVNRQSINSEKHYRIGYTKSMLGLILCADHQVEKGLSILNEAEEIYHKNFSEGHFRFMFLYMHMSYAYEMLNDYKKALLYLKKAQKIANTLWGDKSKMFLLDKFTPIEQLPTSNQAVYNLNYYKNVLVIMKNLFGSQHIRVARYHYLLAQAYEQKHNLVKAKHHYQKALEITNMQRFDYPVIVNKNKKNAEVIAKCLAKL